MKVYVHEKGFVLVGRWQEIRYALKAYAQEFSSVKEWLKAYSKNRI